MHVANHTANNWRFIIGQRFGVDKGGNLYASNAEITGKITANSGTIGGWTIDSHRLRAGTCIACPDDNTTLMSKESGSS